MNSSNLEMKVMHFPERNVHNFPIDLGYVWIDGVGWNEVE
jgi:hypothetical protein